MQFCDVKDATQQGKSKGDTFHWNVYQDVATQGTVLAETKTMPETQYTITQGTLTITEMGNSVPFTQKLDNLSEHPVKEIINKVLKNDAKKAFDIAAFTQFNTCLLRCVGTSSTAISVTINGTASSTNSMALQKEHVKAAVIVLKERNVPAYVNDDYYCLAWPSTYETLETDLEGIQQYTTEGFQMIMNGEKGRYNNCRFVEQTNIPKGGAANSTAFNANTNTSDAWDNGLSSWAFFFGEDTVAEAIAVPEEMRGKIPSDYGRSKGVAWYYLGGFGIVHTAAAQNRILKWDSAA